MLDALLKGGGQDQAQTQDGLATLMSLIQATKPASAPAITPQPAKLEKSEQQDDEQRLHAAANVVKSPQLDENLAADCASMEDSGEFEYEEEADPCEPDDALAEEVDDAVNLIGGVTSDQ